MYSTNKKPDAANTGQTQKTSSIEDNINPHVNSQDLIQAAITALNGKRCANGSAQVVCPAHDDKDPSLNIRVDNGKLLVHCFAGCSQETVISALKNRGLWPKNGYKNPTLPPGIRPNWYEKHYTTHWTYRDTESHIIGYVVRYENDKKQKDTIPHFQKHNSGRWKAGVDKYPRPLYQLDQLKKYQEKPILITEGEKTCDAANLLVGDNYVCMSWPGGTNAVSKADWEPLKGRDIVVFPDADEPGKKASEKIVQKCNDAGVSSIKVIKPPSDVKAGWDLADALVEGWKTKKVLDYISKNQQEPSSEILENKPIPLPEELLPVDPFEYHLLPEALQPWVKDICERIQCPPDFVAVGIMATLGSLIGRKIGIRPQAKTDWTVIPNQWALIVGRPGLLKSPALEQALAPLKRLAAEAQDQYKIAETQFKQEELTVKLKKEAAEKEARKKLKENPKADLSTVLAVDEPDIPALKRYITNDTTPASLGELLRQNTNGILIFRDEMVSLLKGLDKQGQEEGRGFFLTGWNGDSAYTFDRIGRGLNLHIPAVCLSLLGGTQPGRLAEYVSHAVKGGAADDGLIQRFGLIVWPDTNTPWKNVDRFPDNEAKHKALEVFKRLDSLQPLNIGAKQDKDFNNEPDGVPYLRFEPSALKLFLQWRTHLENRLRGELHPALESHFAKYRKLIPALALIIHLVDNGHSDVTERAVLQALAFGEYLESHAQRVYGSVSQPEIAVAKAILSKIKKGDLKKTFGSRDVYRPGWAKLSDNKQVIKGLELLEDYGWIESERIETGGKPKVVYHAHGDIFK